MTASTDARVEEKDNNLINTGGTKTSNQLWRVKINGKSTFVQTRLHKNGSISYVAIEKAGTPGTFGAVERPYVLATVDKDGNTKFGGQGKVYGTGAFGIGGSRNTEVTTEETAKAILSTGTINGNASTQNQQLAIGGQKALALSKQRLAQQVKSGLIFDPDEFVPDVSVGQAATFAEPIQVTPHNANDPAQVVPGAANPENNDPANQEGDSIIDQAADLGGQAITAIKENLPKITDFLDSLKITEADIAKFDKLFEEGGGDTIENAKYPLDANYGDIRGQDYVTIDQFIYQPPRRDQILGTGNINPIQNLTKGQQRITPLKKFVAMVKLPMPNNITDSNSVSWGDDAMNNMSATLTAGVMRNPAMTGIIGGGLSLVNPTIGKLAAMAVIGMDNKGIQNADGSWDNSAEARAKALAAMLQQEGGGTLMKTNLGAAILGALGVNVTPESLLARGFGVIPNSNVELLFNKVTLRDFQFSWRMSPRDEAEALQVKRIIRFFKQGMAAKTMNNQAGGRSLYLGTPNVFRLQYRTAGGQIIEGVNRIKPCAVVGTAVNYTPDGQWSAYDKGQPVSCTLSIQMKELEPVYATDYSQTVIESRRSGEQQFRQEKVQLNFDDVILDIPAGEGDLYKIRPTEVGY